MLTKQVDLFFVNSFNMSGHVLRPSCAERTAFNFTPDYGNRSFIVTFNMTAEISLSAYFNPAVWKGTAQIRGGFRVKHLMAFKTNATTKPLPTGFAFPVFFHCVRVDM